MRKNITLLAFTGLLALVLGCSERSPIGSPDSASPDAIALKSGVIPPDSIKGAALYLYCSSPSLQSVNIHRVTAEWSDTSITWSNFGGAYDNSLYGSFLADVPGWKTADVTTIVREWIGGAYPNQGLLLDQPVTVYPRGLFFSRENPFMKPYLTVLYGGANGDTTIQFPVLRDAAIDQSAPDNSLGLAEMLFTGWAADGGLENQSLLYFDLPVLTPSGPEDDSTGTNEPTDTTIVDPGDTVVVDPGDSLIVEPNDSADVACTRPWPWWLRHSGCRKANVADEVSALLPLWLGTPGGTFSLELDSNCKVAEFLQHRNHERTSPPVKPLVVELLAAKLNIAAGADDGAIAAVISAADLFLADHQIDSRRSVGRIEMNQIQEWYRALHAYNVGDIGPGACNLDNGTEPED